VKPRSYVSDGTFRCQGQKQSSAAFLQQKAEKQSVMHVFFIASIVPAYTAAADRQRILRLSRPHNKDITVKYPVHALNPTGSRHAVDIPDRATVGDSDILIASG
jgi:hypothetical protein